MKQSFTILFLIVVLNLHGQQTERFHEFEPTASSWDVLEWNLTDTTKKVWTIKEITDNKGRVIELQFLKNGKLYPYLCYLANRVTYEYLDNRIIETMYIGNKPLLATDCEMYYKVIYHLDENSFIEKMEWIAKYDFQEFDTVTINKWKEWVPEIRIKTSDMSPLSVGYYIYSYSKMNGLFPISKSFTDVSLYDAYSEPENSSIKKAIEKLINNR